MVVCRRPHGLHAHVVSALQPFRILSQAQRERGEYEIERGGEREREGEGERVRTCSVGFWQAGWPAVGWPVVSLSGWLAVCSTGRASGWMAGWPGGCQGPGMDGWLPSRLPACFPARRLPCGAEPGSPFDMFAPLCFQMQGERERECKGNNGFRLVRWLVVRTHV